jgi:hypothetical protein
MSYETLAEVFVGLERLADRAKIVSDAFAAHAKAEGLDHATRGVLHRFMVIMTDMHQGLKSIEAAMPKDWRKQQ